MAEPTPQYHKNTGTPDQLPQGEASKLNTASGEAQAAINENFDINGQMPTADPQNMEQTLGGEGAPAPIPEPITAQPDTSQVTPPGEDDSLLFGPTNNPGQHVSAGAARGSRPMPPQDAHRWLPALVEAAKDPSAPAMFKDMLQLIQFHMKNGS